MRPHGYHLQYLADSGFRNLIFLGGGRRVLNCGLAVVNHAVALKGGQSRKSKSVRIRGGAGRKVVRMNFEVSCPLS